MLFLPGGEGAPEDWEDQIPLLISRGGITCIFFIIYKETKYSFEHFRFQGKGLSDATELLRHEKCDGNL